VTALHTRISGDLAERIRSGEWPPGRRIPFEHELTAQYGCARATASKAVQALADAGLVERRRRAGPIVASPRIQTAVLEIPELQTEVMRRGQVYAYQQLARCLRPVNPLDPDEASLASNGDVVELRCRHFANGRVLAVEDRLIHLGAAPAAAAADFRTVSPGAWLLAHVAWSEAEHRIGALAADADAAAALDVAVGTACLSLKRWTWRAGEGVTFVRQQFAAETFELVARFAPKSFGRGGSRSTKMRPK
jgi:GntR family histidine utilization transcriptional repressor